MMSSRLLPSLLCNDVQSGILDTAYAVRIFIVLYTLHGNLYKLNSSLI